MATLDQIRSMLVYKEHRRKALADLRRLRNKKRTRRLVGFPLVIVLSIFVAYKAVFMQAAWAKAVENFVHSTYFMPLLFFVGFSIVLIQGARMHKKMLEIQLRLSGLLVALVPAKSKGRKKGRKA